MKGLDSAARHHYFLDRLDLDCVHSVNNALFFRSYFFHVLKKMAAAVGKRRPRFFI